MKDVTVELHSAATVACVLSHFYLFCPADAFCTQCIRQHLTCHGLCWSLSPIRVSACGPTSCRLAVEAALKCYHAARDAFSSNVLLQAARSTRDKVQNAAGRRNIFTLCNSALILLLPPTEVTSWCTPAPPLRPSVITGNVSTSAAVEAITFEGFQRGDVVLRGMLM